MGFTLSLWREHKVAALPKNTKNPHFYALRQMIIRSRKRTPKIYHVINFRGVFTIEEFYGIIE